MSEAEILNGKLFKLIDRIAARGGLDSDEVHAIRGILQCHDGRKTWNQLQAENRKIATVLTLAVNRGALNDDELYIYRTAFPNR